MTLPLYAATLTPLLHFRHADWLMPFDRPFRLIALIFRRCFLRYFAMPLSHYAAVLLLPPPFSLR